MPSVSHRGGVILSEETVGKTLRAGRGKQVKRPANKETCFCALYFSIPKILQRDTLYYFLLRSLWHRVNLWIFSHLHHVTTKKLTALSTVTS